MRNRARLVDGLACGEGQVSAMTDRQIAREATESAVGEGERACTRCGRVLPKNPRGGRPFKFCPESPDEPGVSCLELDKRERMALERAGLGELVTGFRAERDTLLAALQPILGPLSALATRLETIEKAAITQAAHADKAALHAQAEQRTAERAAREAEQRTTRAFELRDEALGARDQAIENEKTAQQDAQTAITRALTAEHARGQAQATAEERTRVLHEEQLRRADAEHETTQLRDQLRVAEREVTRLTGALADADLAQANQQRQHAEQLSATTGELADVRAELTRTQAELHTAVADRAALQTRTEVLASGVEDARRRVEALRAELDQVRADGERQLIELTGRAGLAEQRYRDLTATTQQQHSAAETRYHDLLTALAAGRFPDGG